MARNNKKWAPRPGHVLLVFAVAVALGIAQDLAKDEAESWLKRHGFWPA